MANAEYITEGAVMDPDSAALERHAEPSEIAAYLDDRLPEAEKVRLQAHLAECTACRDEMVELVELMEVHQRVGRRRWIAPVVVAAAAAAALIVLVPAVREDPDEPSAFRAPEAAAEREAVRTIATSTPDADRPVERAGLAFSWQPIEEDASYRVTVTDSSGVPMWVAETDETRLALPEEVGLESGGSYLWFVDAVLPDGSTATSGVHPFQISP